MDLEQEGQTCGQASSLLDELPADLRVGSLRLRTATVSTDGASLRARLTARPSTDYRGAVDVTAMTVCLHDGDELVGAVADAPEPGPGGAVAGVGHALAFTDGEASYLMERPLPAALADRTQGLEAVVAVPVQSTDPGTDPGSVVGVLGGRTTVDG